VGLDDVLAAVPSPWPLPPAMADPVLRNLFQYLTRDWSGFPECEREVALLLDALRRGIAAHCPDRRAAAVLGAGAGRFARELCADFATVEAVDRSLLAAAAFRLLASDGATVHDVTEANAYSAETQVRRFEARVPAGAGLRYTVADALALPFPDRSLSAVVSVYFTDVVPLAPLLAEVARVLAPGGALLHFGPLGYHFDAPAEMLAADEVRRAIEAAGFAIHLETRVPALHCGSAARMAANWFDNWSFVAVKGSAPPPAPIDDRTVLALAGPVRLASDQILTPAEERTLGTRARGPAGKWVELGDVAREVLLAVDGETCLGALVDRLESAHGPLAPSRADVFTMAARLIREGLLRRNDG
jgi:SAM-dependent methyltransferase